MTCNVCAKATCLGECMDHIKTVDTKKPTMLHVVVGMKGGFCREAPDVPYVAGVYTDHTIATKVRAAVHGSITTVELDKVQPGHVEFLNALGFDTSGMEP